MATADVVTLAPGARVIIRDEEWIVRSQRAANSIQASEITLRTVIDYLKQPLVAHARVITIQAGGALAFDLNGGATYSARRYWLLGSMSGTQPGVAIGGSKVELPLNWDPFTDLIVTFTKTPFCSGFWGVLDSQGHGAAIFRHLGVMPRALTGATLGFAYVLLPEPGRGWFTSNPLEVMIVP